MIEIHRYQYSPITFAHGILRQCNILWTIQVHECHFFFYHIKDLLMNLQNISLLCVNRFLFYTNLTSLLVYTESNISSLESQNISCIYRWIIITDTECNIILLFFSFSTDDHSNCSIHGQPVVGHFASNGNALPCSLIPASFVYSASS